jgi:hypothetical protein
MPQFGLLPDGLISKRTRTQLTTLGQFMINSRRLRAMPKVIQNRSDPHIEDEEPHRYDVSINSVTACYDAQTERQRRHHTWVEDVPNFRSSELYTDLNTLAQKLTDAIDTLENGTTVKVFFSIIAVEPRAAEQTMHVDNDTYNGTYWSAIIPLTDHLNQGGTEFRDGDENTPPRGKGYYFGGNVMHRGITNRSAFTRYALMTVITDVADITDINRSEFETPIVITKTQRRRRPNGLFIGDDWAPR